MEVIMKVKFVIPKGSKSCNSKTGPIPASYTEASTCPDSCSFKGNGCYARFSYVRMHWDRADQSWDELCQGVSNLKPGQLWRHNIAGDLPGKNNVIDTKLLDKLVKANAKAGARGFTFTHKPIGMRGQKLINAQAIYACNKSGFTVNLSADNLKEVDEYMKYRIAPVVVTLPSDAPNKLMTPGGNLVIACPATVRDDVTCATCGLCQKANRKAVIGFKAHGVAKKKVSLLVVR